MSQDQMAVDVDAVIESYRGQLSNAIHNMAIKDGIIAQLRKENIELRNRVDDLASKVGEPNED